MAEQGNDGSEGNDDGNVSSGQAGGRGDPPRLIEADRTPNEPQPAAETVLSLSQALLAPLDAILKAQLHASRSFLNFLLQIGYPHQPPALGPQGAEAGAAPRLPAGSGAAGATGGTGGDPAAL